MPVLDWLGNILSPDFDVSKIPSVLGHLLRGHLCDLRALDEEVFPKARVIDFRVVHDDELLELGALAANDVLRPLLVILALLKLAQVA